MSLNSPSPGRYRQVLDGGDADRSTQQGAQRLRGVRVRRGQGRHVDRIPDGLVARRVDYVTQSLK